MSVRVMLLFFVSLTLTFFCSHWTAALRPLAHSIRYNSMVEPSDSSFLEQVLYPPSELADLYIRIYVCDQCRQKLKAYLGSMVT